MQIQVIATNIETKPTQKGSSYQQLEVTYKNLSFQGKVESKKIMSFGTNAGAFKTLSQASPGSVFEVEVVKNAQGYNDWPNVTAAAAGAVPSPAKGATPSSQPGQTRSTYETPEERAQRQVYIIRQSSVDRALQYHSVGAKTPPNLNEVFDTAQKIADFVFQVKDTGPTGFDDMPDFDVPTVE